MEITQTMIKELDVRQIPHEQRSPELIFGKWDALEVGQTLRITADHDPAPLRYAFAATRNGHFEWTPGQAGPDAWVVNVKKV